MQLYFVCDSVDLSRYIRPTIKDSTRCPTLSLSQFIPYAEVSSTSTVKYQNVTLAPNMGPLEAKATVGRIEPITSLTKVRVSHKLPVSEAWITSTQDKGC